MLQSNFPATRVMKHSLLGEAVALSSTHLQEQVRITSVRGHILLTAPGGRLDQMKLSLSPLQPSVCETTGSRGRIATADSSWQVSFKLVPVRHSILQSDGFRDPAMLASASWWAERLLGVQSIPKGAGPNQIPMHPWSGWLLKAVVNPSSLISAMSSSLGSRQPSWLEHSKTRGYVKHSEGQLQALEVKRVMNEVKPGKTPCLIRAQQHPTLCSPSDSLIQQLLKPAPTTTPHDIFQSLFCGQKSPGTHCWVFWGKDFFFFGPVLSPKNCVWSLEVGH